MDSTVPRVSKDDGEETPTFIQVTIPYWIYKRVCTALVAMGDGVEPEKFIAAMLEGQLKRLNI